MASRPRIYVDYDDVLCETALMFTRVLEREFGRTVAYRDIFSFNLERSLGLTPAETEFLMHRVHAPDTLLAMEPLAGAAQTLHAWREDGFDVAIVTGRPPATAGASHEWLQAHAVPFDSLTFVDKYGRGHEPAPGAASLPLDALLQQDYSLAVEDSPEMALLLARRTRVPIVLFDRPWNAAINPEATGADRLARCRGWDEIRRRFPRPPRVRNTER